MKNNAELIHSAINGNQDAIEQIYSENANRVYFLCLKLLKNNEDASDIMQDTFIRAFSHLEQLKNPDALTSWLLSIATSLCKNFMVKNKNYVVSSDDEENAEGLQNIEEADEDVLPEAYADNAETRRLVMDIINRLPDGQRIAIVLFYYNEMSIKEISDVLECSEVAVRSRLFNARKTIKAEVLKLEEKGTKLYGVPIIPLLGNILSYEAINTSAPNVIPKIASMITQSSQAYIATQTTAVSAKTAITGGKVMSKMAKIIIAALATVVVAGGAIAAVVISSNNTAQSDDIIKKSSSEPTSTDNNQSKPSSEPSEGENEGQQDKNTSAPEESSKNKADKSSEESQKAPEVVIGKTVLSGKCGDNVTYTLDESGTMLISGTGEMYSYVFDDYDGKDSTPWWSSKHKIKKVIVESGVTSIEDYAFAWCLFLESITIPDGVTSIGEWAFFGCDSLTSIIIPDSVTSIGEHAFFGCDSLTNITIPDSVTNIDANAFKWCDNLTIHAPKGSFAEEYANDNNIKFVAK